MEIFLAVSIEDINSAKKLFREYADALGCTPCFQNLDAEISGLPGDYAPPHGALILAKDGEVVGCVALKKLNSQACEMKRLYVRPDRRGLGIGRRLTLFAIETARSLGYMRLCLNTLPSMSEAISLYRSLGFTVIEPYDDKHIEGGIYMELNL